MYFCTPRDETDAYLDGGKENQWVKTIPGKGWFTFVRMYGPEKPIFDGTYKLQDIQEVK